MPEAAERALRRDLAAAYRLIAHFGWDDHVATHISARLPDGSYLLNPFGALFEEITASALIRVSPAGEVLSPPGARLNVAGHGVHGGLLAARPDVHCAIHLHTPDGVAVGAMAEGLLPLCQTALLIYPDVATHDFGGVVADEGEGAALARDLGGRHLMLLRNHGTLAVGATVADAFYRIYLLEWCCTAQVRALSTGRALTLPGEAAIAATGSAIDWASPTRFPLTTFWPAMLRKAARHCPGFDD